MKKEEKAKETEEHSITRREFIAAAAGTAAGVAVGAAAGWYAGRPPAPPPVPAVYGWMGKILDVDLTAKTAEFKDLDMDMAKEWIGGRGLGVKIIADEIGDRFDEVDPLGPENILVFATGPLTGTDAPTSGRYEVISKSPLHGGIFDSSSGMYWATSLKAAGVDAVVIRGASDKLVYLWIYDGTAEIVDCPELAGKTTSETTKAIKAAHPGARVACIGPAGENLVSMACVINGADEEGWGRAAGRCGTGAVMGSKKLKAIAVVGTKKPEIADPAGFSAALSHVRDTIAKNDVTANALPSFGTPVLVDVIQGLGFFPTCNFQYGMFDDADKINAAVINGPDHFIGLHPCYNCPIACGRLTKVGEGKWESGEGPEYETAWSLGADCGVGDFSKVDKANFMCNDLGLDTISTGATIACATELAERGLVSELADAGFKFGDGDKVVEYVEKIAKKDGLGAELAKGSWKMTNDYDQDPKKYSLSSRKLDYPAYDPRGSKAHGLAYATSNRGGCHVRAYMVWGESVVQAWGPEGRFTYDDDKVAATIATQDFVCIVDSVALCLFSTFALGEMYYFTDLVKAATGIDYTNEELTKIGEKIWNLERLLDNKAGLKDELPDRMFDPMPEESWPSMDKTNIIVDGGVTGTGGECYDRAEWAGMLDKYYELRGWVDGVPTDAKLTELGLTRL